MPTPSECDFKCALTSISRYFEELDRDSVILHRDIIVDYLKTHDNEFTQKKSDKCKECLAKCEDYLNK